jgi:hypothetical protein
MEEAGGPKIFLPLKPCEISFSDMLIDTNYLLMIFHVLYCIVTAGGYINLLDTHTTSSVEARKI